MPPAWYIFAIGMTFGVFVVTAPFLR